MKHIMRAREAMLCAVAVAALAASAVPASAQSRLYPPGTDCSKLVGAEMTTCQAQLGVQQPGISNPNGSGINGTINGNGMPNSTGTVNSTGTNPNVNNPTLSGTSLNTTGSVNGVVPNTIAPNTMPSVNGATPGINSAIGVNPTGVTPPVNGVVPNVPPPANSINPIVNGTGINGTGIGSVGAGAATGGNSARSGINGSSSRGTTGN